ncbi:TIGR02677 family protein [Mycolicibacterium sarraceniae]|uniref:TIGR02677 family protein n=1 Tax=Mycolicibacterium sarraceniae TaxID=1534348 RepID=A0A7I7SU18_9MYCO|nr:TIGR02677 family protein [Mycolicibacterium sarraceniae]BBY60512.1 hypothetical protein MSAR_36480 [Mycolicibacterium sarraceniae]
MAGIDHEPPPHIDLFRYLSADERVDYIAIMTRFTSSLLADMSATTVAEQLRTVGYALDTDLVEARCKQLVRWGNLVPSLRDARVNTVADYLRARSRFQVTSLGGRVHRGAIEIMAAADGAREVARELLGQIAELLGQIPPLVNQGSNVEHADQLAGIVTTIFNNQRLFTASVTDFYAYLSGVLSRFDLAASEYAEFKSLLLDYIDLITADVNRHSPIIATALDAVIGNLDTMLEILGGVQSLNLGPGVQVERSCGRTRTEWEELHRWYTDAGTESGPAQLRAAAGAALGQLLANAKRMLDASATGYSRRADFLRLATWFDTASDGLAHRIFDATFGAYPSRHLLMGPEEPDPRANPSSSWLETDPIDVPVSLRERGERSLRGRSSRVPDETSDRRMIEVAAREEADRSAAAARELRMTNRLDGATLSPAARDLLLDELARLLALQTESAASWVVDNQDLGFSLRAEPGDRTSVTSSDGSLTVFDYRLTVLSHESASSAEQFAL